MTDNIILIGFMGTGKTTVGKGLAAQLGWKHVDTDEAIEQGEVRRISDIFRQAGEESFRDLETKYLRQILSQSGQVVTTGGGAILRQTNCQEMKKRGTVIQLKAPAEVIVERVKNDGKRPLLQGNISEKVNALLNERAGMYDFADYSIDTSKNTIEETVEKIKQLVFA